MDYENLLKEAEELNLCIKEMALKTKDGLCYDDRIAINSQLKTNMEKCCVLAEELGHYKRTVGNITDQSKLENRKQELIARRWSYRKLVGLTDIVSAYKSGVRNRFEFADYLGVTETFLDEALSYYSDKYGSWYEIDNYIIRFSPLGVLEKFQYF